MGGRLFASIPGHGVYRSIDGGQSWSPSNNGLQTTFVSSLLVVGNTLFAASNDVGSVFKSADGGDSWIPGGNGIDQGISSLVYSDGKLYASGLRVGTNGKSLIYASEDGSNWRIVYTGIEIMPELSLYASETPENSFIDVPSGSWAEDYIIAIYDAGITIGCVQDNPDTPENDRRFCSEHPVTREQTATFLVRVIEGDPPENYCDTGTPFTDVTPTMWSCRYIKRLKELGITTGYGGGRYGPYDAVTREQMAAFITRGINEVPPDGYCDSAAPFNDVSPAS